MGLSTTEIRSIVIAALKDIAPELTDVDLDENAPLRETYDLDSADFLRFLIKLNDALTIEIPESDYGQINSISKITSYLASK